MDIIKSIQSFLGIYDDYDPTKTLGIDVSHWTGIVDWNKAKQAGVKFAIIKAMDGTVPTRYFPENYAGAKSAGILVSAYTWLYKSNVISVGRQARAYYDFLKNYPCDIVPTVDFEWTASGNPNYNDLYGFVTPFEDLYGKKPMIYTAKSYWQEYGSTNNYWSNYPLWIAQYKVSKPDFILPWGNNWKIWQFSDRGRGSDFGFPPNGEKMADLNYFNGSVQDLYDWVGLVIEPPIDPPPVDPPPVIITIPATVVVVPSVNIRSGPGTNYPISQPSKPTGSKVDIYEEKKDSQGNTWGRIDEVGNWCCMIYGGVVYVRYDSVIVEPPPVENQVTVTANSLNVRSLNGTNYPIIGGLLKGEVVVINVFIRNATSVWGEIDYNGTKGWICLFLNGIYFTDMTDFTDIPVNPPPPNNLYKIKDDLAAGIEPVGTRPFIRNGLPSTVRLRGGSGFVLLSPEWMNYVAEINNTESSKRYQFVDWRTANVLKRAVGWHNTGLGNRVEELTFSGNIVEVERIEGEKAFVKTFFNNEEPPINVLLPMPNNLDAKVHMFTTQYPTYLDMTCDNRYPRVFLIANPGEKLWMDIRDLVKINP